MSDLYRRGDCVRVRINRAGSAWARAYVLLDLGADTIVIGRQTPETVKRVQRSDVKRLAARPILCLKSENGICALQRQSTPPSKSQLVTGVLSMCGEWLTSRTAPRQHEPTCAKCRAILSPALEP